MVQLEHSAMASDLSTSGTEFDHVPYIPFLPDDVALECLLRVTPRSHNTLHNVSRKWRNLVNSTAFYEHRRKEGATHQYLCLLQAAPQSNPEQQPVYYISVLDASKPDWERLPPIPELGHLGLPTFCRLASAPGKLIILGGWHPTTHQTQTSVYIFSFTSRTWHRGADMPTPRSFFACSTLSSHHIIVAGGHDHTKTALKSAALYNIATNTWQLLPDMTSARDECTGVTASNTFLAIGGYGTTKLNTIAERYNPNTNTWSPEELPGAANASHAVATSQGVMAFQGRDLVRMCEAEAKWETAHSLPAGDDAISAVATALGFAGGLAVTGPCNGDEGRHQAWLYRLGTSRTTRGVWEAVSAHGDFMGATLASCAVEC